MIGEKHERLSGFRVPEAYPPEMHRIIPARVVPVPCDRLIGDHTSRAIGGGRIHPMSIEVGFGTGHEKSAGLMQPIQTAEIHIAAIHDVDGTSLGHPAAIFLQHSCPNSMAPRTSASETSCAPASTITMPSSVPATTIFSFDSRPSVNVAFAMYLPSFMLTRTPPST